MDDDDSDDTVGKSDYYSIAFIIIKYYDFRRGHKARFYNLTPSLLPDRFNKGRYLSLKGGAIDAEERGDQNALGFVSIGPVVGEKCTNKLTFDMEGVPPCTFHPPLE